MAPQVTRPFNTPSQYTFSIHPVNAPSQYTLSIHALNTSHLPPPHTLSSPSSTTLHDSFIHPFMHAFIYLPIFPFITVYKSQGWTSDKSSWTVSTPMPNSFASFFRPAVGAWVLIWPGPMWWSFMIQIGIRQWTHKHKASLTYLLTPSSNPLSCALSPPSFPLFYLPFSIYLTLL